VDNDPSGHYSEWVELGLLKVTGKHRINQDVIFNDLEQACKDYRVLQLAADPWNASQFLLRVEAELSEHGTHDNPFVVEFHQTLKDMSDPAKELEANMIAGCMSHNNPILDWMAGNVQVYEDPNDNIRPVKRGRSSPLKIDGIVTMIMDIGLSMVYVEPEPDVYEDRGMIDLTKYMEEAG
jgi:phage terminase large subunit-like protein